MDHLLQIAAAAELLAIYYMYEYWYVILFVGLLRMLGMIASSGVNRLANLTPHRRPILTPSRGAG